MIADNIAKTLSLLEIIRKNCFTYWLFVRELDAKFLFATFNLGCVSKWERNAF